MIDDARELASIALFYLFGDSVIPNAQQLNAVSQLLLKQKEWVAAYTDLRTDFLLISHSAPVVLGISPDIFHAKQKYPTIDFVIPREGSFLMVDCFLLAKSTTKDEYIYQFLNYLYRPEVIEKYVNRFYFFPTVKSVTVEWSDLFDRGNTVLEQLRFLNYSFSDQQLRKVWVTVK